MLLFVVIIFAITFVDAVPAAEGCFKVPHDRAIGFGVGVFL